MNRSLSQFLNVQISAPSSPIHMFFLEYFQQNSKVMCLFHWEFDKVPFKAVNNTGFDVGLKTSAQCLLVLMKGREQPLTYPPKMENKAVYHQNITLLQNTYVHKFRTVYKQKHDKIFRCKRLSTGANFVHVYLEIWDKGIQKFNKFSM